MSTLTTQIDADRIENKTTIMQKHSGTNCTIILLSKLAVIECTENEHKLCLLMSGYRNIDSLSLSRKDILFNADICIPFPLWS